MTQEPSVYLPDEPSQKLVYDLEAYKRRLGRYFDKATDHHQRVWFFNRYNETENVIQMLCDKCGVKRKYKPHKLDINNI